MKAHALARPTWPWLHGHRLAAASLRFVTDRFLWLPLGAAIALVWANTAPDSYFRLAHTLAFPVNEIGMAVFTSDDAKEGPAAFLAKRTPQFEGK